MSLSPEALAAFIGLYITVAGGLIGLLIRIEHRFTKLETMLEAMKGDVDTHEIKQGTADTRISVLEQKVGHIARAKSIQPEAEAGGG